MVVQHLEFAFVGGTCIEQLKCQSILGALFCYPFPGDVGRQENGCECLDVGAISNKGNVFSMIISISSWGQEHSHRV